MKYFKSAFILGSTSTIANSLCLNLAKKGCSRFHLVCRNLDKNFLLKNKLEKRFGAVVTEEENDLLFNNSLENIFVPKIDFFDLYIVTAGSLGDLNLAKENISESLRINLINYIGLLPWLIQITKNDRIQSKGSLWVFSSVASDRGRPSNYHYGAAKAALSIFCEGLLLRCQDKPFSIRIIKAGFIKTPMAFDAPSFLCTPPDKVSKMLLRRPHKRGIEYLPWWWFFIMFLVRNLPANYAAKL